MRYLIKNGSIIDPAARVATIGGILIENGKVVRISDHLELAATESELVGDDLEVINARGAVIAPGFIDLHTHAREPGEEQKETIASATRAAAAGGFTTICAMPDTRPALDTAGVVRQVREISRRRGVIKVDAIGAITVGRGGAALSEMAELVEAGCVGFSDNPATIADAALMRNALAYAAMLGVPVLTHSEEPRLTQGWAMHEGAISTRLGLTGFSAAAEEMIIARDIALAEQTGAHIHICTVSTAGGIALIRAAKERGVHVTAEVTPLHLTLTDRWVLGSLGAADTPLPKRPSRARRAEAGLGLPSWLVPTRLPPYDTSTRVCPPLRSEEDCEALIEGLRDGTIDAIATDHSPHTPVEKECEYRLAAPGCSMLETALGLALTLVHRGKMDLVDLIAKLTEGPAAVLGRAPATLRPGQSADVVIFDPEQHWTVDPSQFESRGRSTPLVGQELRGRVMMTMYRGEIVFRRGAFGIAGPDRQPSRLEGILSEGGE
jgi:dihydroorotase